MKISIELAKFLANEGVLTQFISNHKKYPRKEINPSLTISNAFLWSLTPEGTRLWRKLHEKFEEIMAYNENN
jgi:hypothetical protein